LNILERLFGDRQINLNRYLPVIYQYFFVFKPGISFSQTTADRAVSTTSFLQFYLVNYYKASFIVFSVGPKSVWGDLSDYLSCSIRVTLKSM